VSKYIGFAIAFAFTAMWIYRKLRPAKIAEIKSIPTGVSRFTYLITFVMIFVGGILLPMGVGDLIQQVEYQQDWEPSKGFVTELVPSGTNRGRTTYRARFHYQTSEATGSIDHEVLDPRTSEHPPSVSSPIAVLYDPSNPDNAIIDSFQARWLIPMLLISIGLICLSYAIVSIYLIVRLQSLSRMAAFGINVGKGDGRLVRVNKNFFLSLKNKPSWTLIVEYTDLANKKHIAKSEPIWDFHPDTWAVEAVPVPLSIDRSDSSRAWVRVQDYFLACRNGRPGTAVTK
jgi:hypothetical protein